MGLVLCRRQDRPDRRQPVRAGGGAARDRGSGRGRCWCACLGRAWPRAASWPHLILGGALLHGLGLALAHAALVSVDATPTALVHAFHPILTAALGSRAARASASPRGNGSASRLALPASCSACRSTSAPAIWRCSASACSASPAARSICKLVLRRRAAVRSDRRAADRRRADGARADARLRDAALALDRAVSSARWPGTPSRCRSSAWRSTT